MSIFEMNNATNATLSVDTGRIKKNSPVVEVFSALTEGRDSTVKGKDFDTTVKAITDMASRAVDGDYNAIADINSIIRFSIEPKLLDSLKMFDFLGTYRHIGYHEAPMMKTYKYESIDSRFQASSGDVPFAAYSFREYPIGTQTISAGFAVDYRELQSGNFDGSIAEGMEQVKIDMNNKAVYYVVAKLYDALKNAKGVKHFAESNGIVKDMVDDMMRRMRRYGRLSLTGDYSVVSQLNDFVGFKQFEGSNFRFGADAVAEEIRKTGLVSMYNGAPIVEMPNAINWTKLNADGTDYALYMPEGLLFFIPKGAVSPLQIFLRGGMTTMNAQDIVTRQHLTRFDMELGAGVAEGMEDAIGLIADTNFAVPTL